MSDPATVMSNTPRHGLPYLFTGQAQKEFTVNEALARIDMMLHPAVIDERGAEPASANVGDCYLVAPAGSGAFSGHDGNLACWDGDQWSFAAPSVGMMLRIHSSGKLLYFDGSWQRTLAPQAPDAGVNVDTEARAAIGEIITALKNFGIFS